MSASPSLEPPDLLAAYMADRTDLVRFFTARLRSAAAAEDLIQDLYLRLATGPGQGTVQNPSALLYRMAANLMLDRLRGDRRASAREQAWATVNRSMVGAEPAHDAPPADQVLAGRQRLARLAEAVRSLPPQTRRAFELHKLRGLSQAETARTMGVSPKTVEKQVAAALRNLLVTLKDYD